MTRSSTRIDAGSKRRKSKANARLSTDVTERIFDLAMMSLVKEIPRYRTEAVEGVLPDGCRIE